MGKYARPTGDHPICLLLAAGVCFASTVGPGVRVVSVRCGLASTERLAQGQGCLADLPAVPGSSLPLCLVRQLPIAWSTSTNRIRSELNRGIALIEQFGNHEAHWFCPNAIRFEID